MIIKMIGYLLSIFLVIAVKDSDCIAGINSQVVKRGENITFLIDHTKSGKEYDVTVGLNGTSVAQLTCRNDKCDLVYKKPGSLIVYENGILTIMNSSRLDEGIYKILYRGSFKKNETEKCFNVTVIDDDNLPSTIIPDPPSISPSTTPAVSSVGSRSHKIVVIPVGFFLLAGLFINWRYKKKQQHNSDADVGAGDSGVKNLLQKPIFNEGIN